MDDGERLRAFLQAWPPGAQLTTRGLQVLAGFASLADARAAAEQVCLLGLIEMQMVGATRLWRPRERGSPCGAGAAPHGEPYPCDRRGLADRGSRPVAAGTVAHLNSEPGYERSVRL
jgi:hypothetical protein